MKRKFQFNQILLLALLIGQFANVQAQNQTPAKTELNCWASVNHVPDITITDILQFRNITWASSLNEYSPTTYAILEIGLGGSSEGLCATQHRFVASGGFYTGQTVYWDPGLYYPVSGTLIMNPADGKIYYLSGGVIGGFTGDYCY